MPHAQLGRPSCTLFLKPPHTHHGPRLHGVQALPLGGAQLQIDRLRQRPVAVRHRRRRRAQHVLERLGVVPTQRRHGLLLPLHPLQLQLLAGLVLAGVRPLA